MSYAIIKIGDALKSPFNGEKSMQRLIIGMILIEVPYILFIFLKNPQEHLYISSILAIISMFSYVCLSGYGIQVAYYKLHMNNCKLQELPEWKNWLDIFKNGLSSILIKCIYTVIASIIIYILITFIINIKPDTIKDYIVMQGSEYYFLPTFAFSKRIDGISYYFIPNATTIAGIIFQAYFLSFLSLIVTHFSYSLNLKIKQQIKVACEIVKIWNIFSKNFVNVTLACVFSYTLMIVFEFIGMKLTKNNHEAPYLSGSFILSSIVVSFMQLILIIIISNIWAQVYQSYINEPAI